MIKQFAGQEYCILFQETFKMPRKKGMVRRVRGMQGERLAAPEDGWLRECILDVKCANPDFGVKRVLTALRDER